MSPTLQHPPAHEPHHAEAWNAPPPLPAPAALAIDAIPFGPDATVAGELDIAFSTHKSIVLRAQVDFAGDTPPMEVSLVIPRVHCRDDQPLLSALKDAALAAIDRNTHSWESTGATPRRLSIQVNQRWYALYGFAG
ncbi:hypothetical protein [Ideonella oryzae]|uniref:Uncharacterized protein n=1 Tax=Ideonella oryzae TaxID=2937441 RepID=A0ABT1BPJ2_9BURK|nr:hypothetical protein [Ideonella oryzae]MCO5978141.1 hypothetical protein [Ideonella oryzae]